MPIFGFIYLGLSMSRTLHYFKICLPDKGLEPLAIRLQRLHVRCVQHLVPCVVGRAIFGYMYMGVGMLRIIH